MPLTQETGSQEFSGSRQAIFQAVLVQIDLYQGNHQIHLRKRAHVCALASKFLEGVSDIKFSQGKVKVANLFKIYKER